MSNGSRDNAEVADHLHTAVVSDILDHLGYRNQVLSPGIGCVAGPPRVVGTARTARVRPVDESPAEPYALLLKGIDSLQSDDVLVLASDGRQSSGLFGGLLGTAVAAAGARGVLLDGLTRDQAELERLGLPTFAAGCSPLDSLGRDDVDALDLVVSMHGVDITSGDLVVADEDGVVIVPARLVDSVIPAALEKRGRESEMRAALRDGMSASDAFRKFGVL